MPMYVFWGDEEQTILCSESSGKWTWEEYHEALEEVVRLAKSVPHRVDLINLQGSNAKRMPAGSPIANFERAQRLLPTNIGLNIVVTDSGIARMMVATWQRLPGVTLGKSVQLVGTIEEAYALIAKDRGDFEPV